jgi:ubiquinone/menaquinone biosynthesis C-methylase UbiE
VRSTELELLDKSGNDPALLSGNLADLRRVNRWLGGVRLTLRAMERLTDDLRPGDALRVLDVATGGADIPAAMADWAKQRRLRAWILATDRSAEILRLAERPGVNRVEFAIADACQLPFADDSFDVATCSLVLHHLDPEAAVSMLREMNRVARRGIIVNDLLRNWPGYAGAWFLGHALTRNPLTRNDAPLSARRAYTRREMAMLLARAELCPIDSFGFLGYRLALIAQAPA